MNHPNREDLLAYLYDELTPEQHSEVAQHLKNCASCTRQVQSWRSVRSELGAWKISDQPLTTGTQPWRLAKWAAAALVMIGLGFGLARIASPKPAVDVAELRSAIALELRQELRNELAKFATDQSQRQQEYQASLTKALGQIEAQRLVDYASLRKDMETVAVHAEDELQTTRQNLIRLASSGR